MTYRILDLFCGAGGAAEGYHRAGFEVVGVDTEPQPRYRFEFWHLDAMSVLRHWPFGNGGFDAIHASPVCKGYSVSSLSHRRRGTEYPNQIPETRKLLQASKLPYIIENVPGAPLDPTVILCGSQFGLTADVEGLKAGLRRHRLFEANFTIPDAGPHDHSLPPVTVAGHGQPSWTRANGMCAVRVPHWREAMGIEWMTRDEMAQAIPPAYTEYVGTALRQHLDSTRNQGGRCASQLIRNQHT